MQKITYLAAFLLAIIISSCAPKTLQLALTPADDFKESFRMLSTTNTVSQVMGMDVEATSSQEIEFQVEKVQQNPDGGHDLRMMYTDMVVSQASMGQEKNYSSKQPELNNEPNLEQLYDKMLDQPWQMTFQPDGSVTKIEGLEELFENMYADMEDEIRTMMQSQFGAEVIAQLFETMTSYIPKQPVKIGDTWPVSNLLDVGGMRLKVDVVYTLVARKSGVATLGIQGQLVSDPAGEGLQMGEITMKFELVGTQEGQMQIDESCGWVISSNIAQELGGNMIMSGMPTGEDVEAKMELTTNQVLERIRP